MRYFTKEHRKNLSKARRRYLQNESEEKKKQRIERCRETWLNKMAMLRQYERELAEEKD